MASESQKPPRKRLVRSEVFEIYELLKRVGVKKEDNMYVYNPGWNDEVVAKKIGQHVSHWSVKEIRSESFGHLIKPRGEENKKVALSKRIDDLEALCVRLQNRIDALEKKLPSNDFGSNKNSIGIGTASFSGFE